MACSRQPERQPPFAPPRLRLDASQTVSQTRATPLAAPRGRTPHGRNCLASAPRTATRLAGLGLLGWPATLLRHYPGDSPSTTPICCASIALVPG